MLIIIPRNSGNRLASKKKTFAKIFFFLLLLSPKFRAWLQTISHCQFVKIHPFLFVVIFFRIEIHLFSWSVDHFEAEILRLLFLQHGRLNGDPPVIELVCLFSSTWAEEMNITCRSRCQSYQSRPLPPEDHGTPAANGSRRCVGWWKEEIGANGMHSELMGEFQCPPGIAENWS